MIRIAVDAMGGDNAPDAILAGCVEALRAEPDLFLLLVGKQERIRLEGAQDVLARTEIIDARETIENTESPVLAIRKKADASIVRAAMLVREGAASAMVTAGSTGAALSCGLFRIGRVSGIDRPALATLIPTLTGSPTLLLDIGANVDCRPEWLLQFARMGTVYAKGVMGVESPRVALLNLGEEDEKGNDLTKRAHALLREGVPGFIGNLEPRALTFGDADVVVCDGFAGNTAIKSMEGVAKSLFTLIKRQITATTRAKIGALLVKPALMEVKRQMDPDEIGGAPLLGLTGALVKAHGSSNAHAFCRAIQQARKMIEKDIIAIIGGTSHV